MKTKTLDPSPRQLVTVSPPRIATTSFDIIGTAPYVQLAFSEKARAKMRAKMEAGSLAAKGKAKKSRDFDEDFLSSLHQTTAGRYGIPAGAFRNAMISACRLVGFKMTMGKMSVFVVADDFERSERTPMVHINGNPEMVVHHVRNATGVADLRVRALFFPWSATVRIEYDEDQFSTTDVANLLTRAGIQVGIGEGRPDSKSSAGMGWGTFQLAA